MVEDTLVERAGTLGLEPKVVREALTMHVDELLHTRGVLRLVKAQINGMMPGVYFGLLLPLLIIALLVALEIWAAQVRVDAAGGAQCSCRAEPTLGSSRVTRGWSEQPSVGSALISSDSGTLGAESPARTTVRSRSARISAPVSP